MASGRQASYLPVIPPSSTGDRMHARWRHSHQELSDARSGNSDSAARYSDLQHLTRNNCYAVPS